VTARQWPSRRVRGGHCRVSGLWTASAEAGPDRAGSPVPIRPTALRGRVFLGTAVVGQGLLTPKQLRSSAWVDLIHFGDRDEAVVLFDRLVQAGLARLDDVRTAAVELPSCRGSAQGREVARLADGRVESPQESLVRLILHPAA
jgi:hypothetical protein